MAHVVATFDQRVYRFRNDDGSESAATWKAAQNTTITQVTGEVFRLRVAVQETAGGGSNNQTIVLQSNINNAGWFDVGPSTNGVRLGQSPHVVNQTPTTRQLTGTSGTFRPGLLLTQTSGTDISFSGNDHTEVEWASLLITSDVPANATVQFRVTIQGAVANTVTASPSLTAEAPAAPTMTPTLNLVSVTPSPPDITLNWSNIDPTASDLEINYAEGPDFVWQSTTGPSTAQEISFNEPTIATGKAYRFRLRATNVGGAGPWSNIIETSTVPPVPTTAPTLTSPSKAATSIQLEWTSVTNADTYELQRDSVTIQNTAGTIRNDTGLTSDTTYTYRVRGVSAGGPGPWSDVLNITTGVPPSTEGFYTDFSEYLSGQLPSGWEEAWRVRNLWTVEDDASFVGAKRLVSGNPTNARDALVWSTGGLQENVEITARILLRGNSTTDRCGLSARVSGAGGSETGIQTHVWGTGVLHIRQYVDGVMQSTYPGHRFDTLETDYEHFHYIKLRVENFDISAKIWREEEPEPGWHIFAPVHLPVNMWAGASGVFTFGQPSDWDWVHIVPIEGSSPLPGTLKVRSGVLRAKSGTLKTKIN